MMNDDEKVCPQCAETIKKAALICKHCRYSFAPAAPLQNSAGPMKPLKVTIEKKPNRRAIGCALILVLAVGFIGIVSVSNNPLPSSADNAPAHKWEAISGIQQSIRLVTDIDDNSIERASDGASATVDVKLSDSDIEKITYICRIPDPASDMHGGIIWKNNVTDLPFGSTGEAVMKRVCYGPLP